MIDNERYASLLDGRNVAPLSEDEQKRAANTLLGLDRDVNARYEQNSRTRFVVNVDDSGTEFGEIIYSSDIFPGPNLINPNAALSMRGAAAHELTHYHRWLNKSELPHGAMTHIDEAMTSLEAAIRYSSQLYPNEIQGLISDALHRLSLFVDANRA
jgi:hypothetical protein